MDANSVKKPALTVNRLISFTAEDSSCSELKHIDWLIQEIIGIPWSLTDASLYPQDFLTLFSNARFTW